MASASNNKLNYVASAGSNSVWTVSFSGGNAVVTCKGVTADNWKIQYNIGSPRFSNYKTTQATIQLYMYVE